MSDDYTPTAGWYDDPERALRLRWWDGVRWTTHTRAKPIVEEVPVPVAVADMSSSDSLAVPGWTQPYGYSAPYSWSPSMPSAAEPAPRQAMEYAPERTTTPAAWALAFTPIVTVLAQTAAVVLSGIESTPVIWIIGATIIPVLWIIIWVRRDRIMLHEWGHLRRAHWGWAFLGAIGYLLARWVVVNRQARGHGWGPLVVVVGLLVGLVSLGFFYTPLFGVLRTVSL